MAGMGWRKLKVLSNTEYSVLPRKKKCAVISHTLFAGAERANPHSHFLQPPNPIAPFFIAFAVFCWKLFLFCATGKTTVKCEWLNLASFYLSPQWWTGVFFLGFCFHFFFGDHHHKTLMFKIKGQASKESDYHFFLYFLPILDATHVCIYPWSRFRPASPPI